MDIEDNELVINIHLDSLINMDIPNGLMGIDWAEPIDIIDDNDIKDIDWDENIIEDMTDVTDLDYVTLHSGMVRDIYDLIFPTMTPE